MPSLRDDRAADPTDRGVLIGWCGVACQCRCRHCLLESQRGPTRVPFGQARAVAERFAAWREAAGRSDFPVDLWSGYPEVSPYVEQCIAFNKQHGATEGHVAFSGRPLVRDRELRAFLLSIRQAGAVAVSLTFHGLRAVHDAWTGRTGHFDFLLRTARLAAEVGLPRQETIFLSLQAIPGIPALLELLDATPGLTRRGICIWDYRGRGKMLEELRPTRSDLATLPESIREQVHPGHGRKLCTEAEWIGRIHAGDFPRRSRRYYLLAVHEDTVDEYLAADPGAILERVRDVDERLLRALPPLAALADRYGRREGDRLYTVRDLEWKWVDAHLAAHPEIDPAARFTDFGPSIMWS